MMDIAPRVGVAEATNSTYFASKRDLCVRVLGNWYDEIISRVERECPLIDGLSSARGSLPAEVDGTGLFALIQTVRRRVRKHERSAYLTGGVRPRKLKASTSNENAGLG